MRKRRNSTNPIFEVFGRAVTNLIRSVRSSDDPIDWDHLEWLATSLRQVSRDVGPYLDRGELLIDPHSHPSHAMNPIDRRRLTELEFPLPSQCRFFRCIYCGAVDHTSKAAVRCPRDVPS